MSRTSPVSRLSRPLSARAGRGFTLIELLIVLAIIAALGGLVTVAVLGRKKEATAKFAEVDMGTIKEAMRLFFLSYERFPTEEEGIDVLWNKEKLSPDADAAKWKKFLEEPMPNDRWGTPWGYRQMSEHGDEDTYDLWSAGPDKQEGTDDDIKNWKDDTEGLGADGTGPAGDSGASKGSGG
ncbi:MAG: type II secretion system major pseudopilin GspG [Phycisphaerales bacterium]|nr:type II secretion system major pseudopilin GspG [Phycisphaerales bacterium]